MNKETERIRKWRKKNPQKYEAQKERINAVSMARYHQDPEFRSSVLAKNAKWRKESVSSIPKPESVKDMILNSAVNHARRVIEASQPPQDELGWIVPPTPIQKRVSHGKNTIIRDEDLPADDFSQL